MPEPLILIHHKAHLDTSDTPPNSLAGVRACLDHGAPIIEIDVIALASDDFLLVHDHELASETTGNGAVGDCTPQTARSLHLKPHRDGASPHPVALLSDVVAALLDHGGGSRLHVDWKDYVPFPTDEPLHRLARILKPLGDRVFLTHCADWQLRRLRRIAPWLEIGFEVQFYFDLRDPAGDYDPMMPPYRQGAYGFHDDHPLALAQSWPIEAYLADRCDMLLHQAPGISTVCVSHHTLMACLNHGFNWADAVRDAGLTISTWTLDADNPVALSNARTLYDAGIRRFTSNTPLALAQHLNSG